MLASLAVVAPAHADATLDGVSAHTTRRTTQVVTVKHTRGWHARVTYWTRDPGGPWEARRQVIDGRTGYGGLVRAAYRAPGHRHHAARHVPAAVALRHPRAVRRLAVALPADPTRRLLGAGQASDYYNRYRNKAQGGFRWWLPSSHADSSERLTDFRQPYEYAVVTSFNREQVRHRGAGIFLHVNGRGATAGCVSAPRWLLRYLVRVLDPARGPVVAIGR